jgi:hypothetical protein
MLKVTADNVEQKRTIRMLYAQHQATPYACFLDPAWARTVDILPGMVMTKLDGEKVTLFGVGGTPANHTVFGLSALFVAPVLGIDEVRPTGTNHFGVWVGDNQSVFEVLAPAFDTSASWTNAVDGSRQPLRVTLAGHAQGPGKLTTAAAGANVSAAVAAHLIQAVSSSKIIVSLQQA